MFKFRTIKDQIKIIIDVLLFLSILFIALVPDSSYPLYIFLGLLVLELFLGPFDPWSDKFVYVVSGKIWSENNLKIYMICEKEQKALAKLKEMENKLLYSHFLYFDNGKVDKVMVNKEGVDAKTIAFFGDINVT